ncbi:MAG: hypothetical protein IJ523_01855 [Succinivibrionaceae bacterium]|nr:hypothetical protein [Succinivibrionaceae bacterium]
MNRKLEIRRRGENVREPRPLRAAVQFDIPQIRQHFQESLNEIKRQFEVAEYLVSNSKREEADNIYRSQIVFLESSLDFFMHEITKYGLHRIFTNCWARTDRFERISVPMSKVFEAIENPESTDWFFNYVSNQYSDVVLQSWDAIRDQLNLVGIPWSGVCRACNPDMGEKESIEEEKTFLVELYQRRNRIAHQNDRNHANAEKQDISRTYVEFCIGRVCRFVDAVCAGALDR